MISLALSLALTSSGICNPLQKCNLELEARVGIDHFSPCLQGFYSTTAPLFHRFRLMQTYVALRRVLEISLEVAQEKTDMHVKNHFSCGETV